MWLKFEKKILKIVRYGACRFEKTCFEKNTFKVPSKCVNSAGSAGMRDARNASGKTRN